MTDTISRQMTSNSSSNVSIKIKPTISKNSITRRRSQRRRTTVLSSLRTSASPPLLLTEAGSGNESTVDTDDNQKTEIFASLGPNNKLVFTTTSTTNSKASYWTVTDRQPQWYKLSIPINQSIFNYKTQIVPYKRLSEKIQNEKPKSDSDEQINEPSDPTQLVMKTVMRELDYDMDDDDLEFLHEINRQNIIIQKRQISEEEFENAIIILEFSAAEKIHSYINQKFCDDDDKIVCDICLLPDADDGNEMVFCERCHCCVHQNCYGIAVIPTGTWLCKPCSILRRPACILCPKLGGPMKCTASGTIWCHLTCVLWLPELKFADYVNMEPILHLNKIPHTRWSLRCVICSTTEGACVQCAHKNCRTPFHVTCGLAAGYFLDIQQTTTKEPTIFRSQFNAYCSKHSDEARKRSEEESIKLSKTLESDDDDDSSCSSSPSSSSIPLTIYHRDQLKNEQWINECYKKFSTFISSSRLHEECPNEYDENLSKKLYEYWIRKRQMNNTMPLIKHIEFVFEQRESADLLITQINTCLTLRKKMLQLQNRCESMLDALPSSSEALIQRLESLKKTFSLPIVQPRGRGHPRSLSSVNKHKNENKTKLSKRNCRQVSYSDEQLQTIEQAKHPCIVKLETTYRHSLELNTTYLIHKTIDGQMILVPKKLIEQEGLNSITDDIILQRLNTDSIPSTNYSDISNDDDNDNDDEEDIEPCKKKRIFKTAKTTYTSQGNVVTCVTGSFN
ncbi:unnamed protein product [Rotaria magnacalcarata]|uniref:Uncharacterized protein n=7 Tax=Rotaria magnacalcarata TaxID=392030 RepID=A0A815MQ85_9BILA|nr:unnamed protein product [Rotaria magnacalcarata]CAF1671478.1 unnamed protein product [Rotaria magnacalcarata]